MDNLIGKQFDYLTVKKYYNENSVYCQCKCGRRVNVKVDYLLNSKKKKSCGCFVTKKELPTLYKLYSTFSLEEKSNFGSWDDFVLWSRQNGYAKQLSYYKPNRSLLYNKDNLLFGVFINKEFFSIKQLRGKRYFYTEREGKFVTSKKVKGRLITNDKFTKALNEDECKHKTMSTKMFEEFKKL